MTTPALKSLLTLSLLLTAAACGAGEAHEEVPPTTTPASDAPTFAVIDTLLPSATSADGVAAPMREATLSTKLMAAVTAILVQEGDVVRAGQLLVQLDARDLTAKREQVAASVAAAEAMYAQANAHAARIRALFVDSAAPKAMLEAAEASLAQAASSLRGAKAAGAELTAVESYAEVRAPFAGRVTQRFVDVGAFAAPGAPLVSVQDASTLRVTAHVAPEQARGLRVGQRVSVSIEGLDAEATIEGVVPTMGSLYAVNAIVANRDGRHLAGSAAALHLPGGLHRVLAIPVDALITEGDMVGVVVRVGDSDARRWIRTAARVGGLVEVTAGLKAGDLVVRRTTGAR